MDKITKKTLLNDKLYKTKSLSEKKTQVTTWLDIIEINSSMIFNGRTMVI